MEIVLCSGSPRRLQILKQLGFAPQVIASEFVEDLPKSGVDPADYVRETSRGKLDWVKANFSLTNALLVAADTVVVCNGEVYEKPLTAEANLAMLRAFHDAGGVDVLTSVWVFSTETNTHAERTVSTRCEMAAWVTDADLAAYAASGEGHGAAGGFMIQGRGAALFGAIAGDFYNVVGLPASVTYELVNAMRDYKQ